jgi:uncharacterized protein YndB with AHSA1/START domain
MREQPMQSPASSTATYIHATPEQLWDALTNPQLTSRYFFRMAVQSDWSPDAPVTYRGDDGDVGAEGRVIVADAPRRLTLSFALRFSPQVSGDRPSRLNWQIEPMGEVCKLTVTHDDAEHGTVTAQLMRARMPAVLNNLKLLLEVGTLCTVQITFDCAEPERLASFWAQALGFTPAGTGDGWAAVADPHGVRPRLLFLRVPERKTVKNRVHLDVNVVGDLEAEAARLVALGAHQLRRVDEQGQRWTVMSDPEGNEFCIQ